MKVVILPSAMGRSLGWSFRWIQRALFAGAILMLGYCAFVMADTWIFQREANRELVHSLEERPVAATQDASALPPAGVAIKGLIGRIDIVRLGLSVVVMEGTSTHTLRRAAGHIEGTALPGERGNVGISAHRDTLFRPLRDIHQDDIITVTTPGGEYRYRVVSTRVVSPENTSVLDSDGTDILTLVTCYPFYFVGPAPDRFVVRAERVI
jgi:sortase A